MAREDRFGRGSDQSSFTQNGFPAVVFRESNENFERQHGVNDKIDGVDSGISRKTRASTRPASRPWRSRRPRRR